MYFKANNLRKLIVILERNSNNLFNNNTLTLTLSFRSTNIAAELNDHPIPCTSEVEKSQKLKVMKSDFLEEQKILGQCGISYLREERKENNLFKNP